MLLVALVLFIVAHLLCHWKDEKMKLLQAENMKLKRTIKKLQALHHWRRIAMKFKYGRNASYLFSDFME